MFRSLFLVGATAFVASCTAPAAPRPLSVEVTSTQITVPMSDGSTCVGPAPEGAHSWSGRLQGCDSAYPYTVEIDPGTNPVRYVLQEVFTAIGLDDAIAPVAEVTITDGQGRLRRFASPEPRVE